MLMRDTTKLWKVFRITFVVFSLYLMGDVFRRWDGVKYYSSLSEFLPSIALVFILWTFFAGLFSLLIWISAKLGTRLVSGIKFEDVFVFIISIVFLSVLLYWKKGIFRDIEITNIVKGLIILFLSIVAVIITWVLRNKSEILFASIDNYINPLVWLFMILLVFSIPSVIYKTLGAEQKVPSFHKKQNTAVGTVHRPNILLITFDAMTARNMSVYGYKRKTTPFIEKWAESAFLFSRVKSESNYTTPTTQSLMTAKRVWTHQTYFVEVASKFIGENNENLPYLLKKNGYTNVAIQQVYQASVKKLGLAGNFDIIFGPEQLSQSNVLYQVIDRYLYRVFGEKIIIYDWIIKEDFILFKLLNKLSSDSAVTSHPPERAFGKFLELLDNGLNEPYFTWIHLYAPHDPYLPPEPYKGMFNDSQALRTWKSQKRSRSLVSIDVYRDRYDEFIRYADSQFEKFITGLEQRNATKDTVIILSSDHGESFAHNYKGHGGPHLYEDLTHIPLMIKEPNMQKGKVIDDLSEQIDVAPTILDMAKIPIPSWMEGRSLIPLMRGEFLVPKPAFSMSLVNNPSRGHEITSGTLAIWKGDYKLIHYLNNGKTLLFNLREDPDENNNILDKEPKISDKLLIEIKENLQAANERIRMSR